MCDPRHLQREKVQIKLVPSGKSLEVQRNAPLQEVLFGEGAEFPCGGKGKCKRCRVRVLEGDLPVTSADANAFSTTELRAGWRLACQARAETDLTIELAQWVAQILSDNQRFEFVPEDGLGAAVDLGTTTIVVQLLDLRTGNVLGVRTALNGQARYGADIMSRVDYARSPEGLNVLCGIVREQIGRMIFELATDARAHARDSATESQFNTLRRVVVVGNAVMHHLFCKLDVEPFAHYPFEPNDNGLKCFSASELGWTLDGEPTVMFMPCLGGFVGSDILAGILATELHKSERPAGLIDLGTNGEIVFGTRDRLLCASTAAGPAFEGARISTGMIAATGAISSVSNAHGRFICTVLGGGKPRGICGSGLVDAVAVALDLGLIDRSGRLTKSRVLHLDGPVTLTQKDIRELQLAKSAIAAGLRLLLERWGATTSDVSCLWLAGAFGNYINRVSAHRIGLIPVAVDKVKPAGNTALRGAKLMLLNWTRHADTYLNVQKQVQHVALNQEPEFHEAFVSEMRFPEPASSPERC